MYSIGREAYPAITASVRAKRITSRPPLTHSMILRRSERSTILPACKAKISHGRLDITPSAAISEGERVNCAASRGSVTWYSPSPRLEKLFALHTFQKFVLDVTGVDTLSDNGVVSMALSFTR